MSEPTSPAPAPASTSGLPRHIAAGLACVFSIVGGVVFLVLDRRDPFVRFWALQSILLGAVALAVGLLLAAAGPLLGWLPLIGGVLVFLLKVAYWVFQVAWVVVYFVCLIRAFSGQEWEIPVLGAFARKQLPRFGGAGPAGE